MVEDASAAMHQLWELKDNLFAAHEISAQIVAETKNGKSNLLRTTAILRMTMSWNVITLWKVHELWQRYAYLASDEAKRKMGQINKEILERNIKRVRNTIAAHLLDDGTKNPVSPSTVFADLQNVWGDKPEEFLIWLVGNGPRTHSVYWALQAFFDELQGKYPAALQNMMLAEQKKMTGYPSHLPKFIDKDGHIIR